MAFRFEPYSDQDVGDAFLMPPLPFGISHGLRTLVDQYTSCVLGGDPGSEDAVYSQIDRFEPNGLPDVVTKMLFNLHFDAMGSNGERLLIINEPKNAGRIAAVQGAIDDLCRFMPQDWKSARAAYEAALAAEQDYDRREWTPAWEVDQAGGPKIPKPISDEIERLQDIRCNAENVLLDMPAPDWPAFAFKYLVCFDNDRDLNGYHEALCAEAKRLLAEARP